MKYFSKDSKDEFLLSEYLDVDSLLFSKEIFTDKDRVLRTKYLIDVLGDVKMDIDTYKLFIRIFQSFGGPYSVLTSKETLKGIYEIYEMYPFLTCEALHDIWFLYIRDLFEEYELSSIIELFIKTYGMKDETFLRYIDYVEKKGKEHQKLYEEDALKVSSISGYSDSFLLHIKGLILRKHIMFDKIMHYMPEAELIKKDEEHLIKLQEKTRIFMGCSLPVSYVMMDELLLGEPLEEEPTYYVSTGLKERATFTKEDFISSISKKIK